MKKLLIFIVMWSLLAFTGIVYGSGEDVDGVRTGGGSASISDTAYDATSWNGVTTVGASKNAIRDEIEAMGASAVEDDAYGAGWDGDTTHSPSQNAVYDQMELHCLESVFGTSLGAGIILDTGALKVSAVLQEYHAVNPTTAGLALLDDAAATNQRTTLGLIIGTDVLAPDGSGASLTGIPLDADFTSNELMKRTGAGTYGVATADTDYQQPIVWGSGLTYSAPTASLALTELDDVTWGIAAGTSQTWTWDTGAGTDPSLIIADASFTFNKEIIATSFNTGGSATPGLIMRDTDADGSDPADEYTFTLESGISTATEDGEISDFALTAWGAGTAGTQYTHIFWDGSDSHLYMGVLAAYTAANPSVAPIDLATYESLVWDFDYDTDTVGVSSPVSGTTTIDFTTLKRIGTGSLAGTVIITTADARELTAAELSGGIVLVTTASEVSLPDVCDSATGANVMIVQRDASETVEIGVTDTADDMTLDGVALGANQEIDSAGGAGDAYSYICMVCVSANMWANFGRSGTWVDGGAAN